MGSFQKWIWVLYLNLLGMNELKLHGDIILLHDYSKIVWRCYFPLTVILIFWFSANFNLQLLFPYKHILRDLLEQIKYFEDAILAESGEDSQSIDVFVFFRFH